MRYGRLLFTLAVIAMAGSTLICARCGDDADDDDDDDTDTGSDTGAPCDELVFEGDVTISEPADLDALAGVTRLTGDLRVNCPDCGSLAALECLEEVQGDFLLGCGPDPANDSLASLEGLERLAVVAGSFYIENNDAIEDLAGLENLEQAGVLYILYNDSLTSLAGLSGLVDASALIVQTNQALAGLSGLANLRTATWLGIWDNSALVDLSGLAALEQVNGEFSVSGNAGLTGLDGLDALDTVAEALLVQENTLLPTCAAVDLADHLAGSGTLGGRCIRENLADECPDDESGC
ncbi:MAG TPA: hypothetical protein VM285_02150 [Polyangia bacterium]|nr:hypothetical protein [Polyangia bacterium]